MINLTRFTFNDRIFCQLWGYYMEFLNILYDLLQVGPLIIACNYLAFRLQQDRKYELQKNIEMKEGWINYNEELLKYTLQDYVPQKNIYKHFPKELETAAQEILYSLNKYEELTPLIGKLISHLGVSNLPDLFFNLENLNIHYVPFYQRKHLLLDALGTYSYKSNEITIYKNKPGVLEHEFLHAASSREICKNGTNYSLTGFSILGEDLDWFRGLNEGYTELLNERIFGTRQISYKTNTYVIKYLENIFDNPHDMEKAYFYNDIDSIIYQFLEYGSKEEFLKVMRFLNLYSSMPATKTERDHIVHLICDIIKRSGQKDNIDKCQKLDEENKFSIKKLVKKF